MSGDTENPKGPARLVQITLDENSVGRRTPDVEHERKVAIFDLLEDNSFALQERDEQGPYTLHISISENRLVFAVGDETADPITSFMLSLSPFRKIVKDYFMVCESYYEAIKTAPPSRIEALDMGRRGLHNEGSQLLMKRLDGKIKTDFDTARRLFTLICALHWKG
ncbi:MAG: UPF0262 family protein [Hyphomicrobiaceae bacterium]|nr:UPF0262 family protein [Hyphomicrobiaceae bacterium]